MGDATDDALTSLARAVYWEGGSSAAAGGVRLMTIPDRSSVPLTLRASDHRRMRFLPPDDRIVDVMLDLARFTVMTRGRSAMLTDRYSERVESLEDVSKRVNG
ncbi:hypothetical protein [Yoonia sp.]|uniref:hypothetical protein n=1 Tax=Yoonia sp. TaxID=2212373 RepID=UPI002FDA8993